MNFEKYLNYTTELLFSQAQDRDELLKDIAKQVVASSKLPNIDETEIFNKLKERESVGSTAFGKKIAIPHCSLKEINDFMIGVIISEKGINFYSPDGTPTHLFIYVLAPSKKRNEHIRILSEISKVLRDPEQVNTLVTQKNVEDLFNKFIQFAQWDRSEEITHEYTQISIHLQNETVFEQTLEFFTEIKDCHISVIEAHNASKYLYAVPLFSQFINQEKKGFHRLIIAVVDSVYTNHCLRSINRIAEKNKTKDLMVTTIPLSYFKGSINI